MSKRSVYSCIVSLAILSVYIFLFGFTGEIGVLSEDTPVIPNESSLSVTDNENISAETDATLYPPPITRYETNINASNYAKPGFADFPAQTTAPFYYDTDLTTTSTETSSALNSSAETTTTTSTATTTVTSTEAATVTETAAETTTAATIATTAATTTSGDTSEIRFTVSNSGTTVTDSALNIISKIVQREVGSSFEIEAIKAQAVASYTFVKMHNDSGATPSVMMSSVVSERVTNAVKQVLGEAVYYNGQIIQAVYCASSAGQTASSGNVWGVDYPYLRSVITEFDSVYDPNYGVKKNVTKNEMMTLILEKTGINPTGEPSEWIKIINRVDGVYVGDMTISGKASYASGGVDIKITGRVFRERIFSTSELKSSAFDVLYDEAKELFTFTTYGYGHGVGLSQNGANILARYNGYDYKQILQFYYQGTEIY